MGVVWARLCKPKTDASNLSGLRTVYCIHHTCYSFHTFNAHQRENVQNSVKLCTPTIGQLSCFMHGSSEVYAMRDFSFMFDQKSKQLQLQTANYVQ